METVIKIAKDELRYWQRSRLAWFVVIALLVIASCSAFVSHFEMSQREQARLTEQAEANATFQEQPNRHPHRMVHYGHYVYRTPSPLAAVDPGIDSVVGTSIFLEGHRQNTATFTPAKETGLLARFGVLSPALVFQLLVPLFMIICGFASVAREREQNTLYQLIAQGVTVRSILFGKSIALATAGLLAIVPMAVLGLVVTSGDDAIFRASFLTMLMGYLLYIVIWSLLIVSVSSMAGSGPLALSLLLGLWVSTAVLMPRLAGNVVSNVLPMPSQLETYLDINQALRGEGDGHNVNDPAFANFREQTLKEYGVESIEELPFNYRGLVAMQGEEIDTGILNEFAEERMAMERDQKRLADYFGLLAPSMAMRAFSASMAGSSLAAHHHFLKAAEDYRFNMVQTFNRLQMDEVSYADDIARSNDERAEQSTRVDAAHWREMPVFNMTPASDAERFAEARPALMMLVWWLLLAVITFRIASTRVVQ